MDHTYYSQSSKGEIFQVEASAEDDAARKEDFKIIHFFNADCNRNCSIQNKRIVSS